MRVVIVIGDLALGIQTIHGPFEDKQHAIQWASINVGQQSYIIEPLNEPGRV